MKRVVERAGALLGIALLLMGCGSTMIHVASEHPYDIYVDGQLVGTSVARIRSAGLPHTAQVEARDAQGQVRGSTVMKRDFMDWRTLFLGIATSGIGFAIWYYPDQVDVLLYQKEEAQSPAPFEPAAILEACETSKEANMAVLALQGPQFDAAEMDALTARLETELIKRTPFTFLERRNMDLILSEQGFQQSGSCTDNECQLRMGQLLGVDHIVTGAVSRVGSLLTMNLRIVSVASGKNEYSSALDMQGGLEEALVEGSAQAASAIAQKFCPRP